jgi:hypothetical protein
VCAAAPGHRPAVAPLVGRQPPGLGVASSALPERVGAGTRHEQRCNGGAPCTRTPSVACMERRLGPCGPCRPPALRSPSAGVSVHHGVEPKKRGTARRNSTPARSRCRRARGCRLAAQGLATCREGRDRAASGARGPSPALHERGRPQPLGSRAGCRRSITELRKLAWARPSPALHTPGALRLRGTPCQEPACGVAIAALAARRAPHRRQRIPSCLLVPGATLLSRGGQLCGARCVVRDHTRLRHAGPWDRERRPEGRVVGPAPRALPATSCGHRRCGQARYHRVPLGRIAVPQGGPRLQALLSCCAAQTRTRWKLGRSPVWYGTTPGPRGHWSGRHPECAGPPQPR